MRIRVLSAVFALASSVVPAVAFAADSPQETVDGIELVTGDRVSIGPGGTVTAVQPGEGRDHIGFRTHRRPDGHTLVIPHDAAAPLAADRLDQRLFDVTALLEFGYRDRMPLIVDGQPRLGARTANDWASLKNSSGKVWLDGLRKPMLDRSVAQVGAPAAHRAGLTGQGVKVAVVDSGIDQAHPDLLGQEIASRNFTLEPDQDTTGHGTHVAATIASTGSTFGGVAPGARLLDAKVCMRAGCPESSIINGLRWAAEQGAQVVNVSLGGVDTPETDPVEREINALTRQYGVLFVVAAGNGGGAGTLSSPGSAAAALTVGAVDREDKLAPFSNEGPAKSARGTVKPEVTAPGTGIVAADAGSDGHVAASGTSMAAPHVAGAAALLKQQHPEWTAAQLKAVLTSTAKPTGGLGVFQQGAGRVDVAKAVEQRILADSATVDLGFHYWPHFDDLQTRQPVTYTNLTDEDVSLDLRISTTAAAGVFSLNNTKITVPAHGTASVDLIGDPRVGQQNGTLTGELVATSGSHTVRTLVGIDREVESYQLKLDHIGDNGQDPYLGQTMVTGLDVPYSVIVDASRDHDLRLPKGTYLVDSVIYTFDEQDRFVTAQLVHPGVRLQGNQTLRIDLRETQQISVTAPEPTSGNPHLIVGYQRTFDSGTTRGSVTTRRANDVIRTKQLGSPPPAGEFSSLVSLDAAATVPSTAYRLAYQVPGFPTGLTRAPRREDLARIETTFAGTRPGTRSFKAEVPWTSLGVVGFLTVFPIPHGSKAVDLVTTENMRWSSLVDSVHPDGVFASAVSPYRTYEADRTYAEHEIRPVFSPGLPQGPDPFTYRTGGQLELSTPLLGDGNLGWGMSSMDSARTALYRDGELVGEVLDRGATFRYLPAKESAYRVEQSLERGSKFELSTRVSAAWTFRSAATPRQTALPLSVVRFDPKLDADGAVPAGTLQRLGLHVQSQGDVGDVRVTGVEYSFDDGGSWRRAGISGASALIYHPANTKYVSLRATAEDSKGSTAELTVIRAYRVTAG